MRPGLNLLHCICICQSRAPVGLPVYVAFACVCGLKQTNRFGAAGAAGPYGIFRTSPGSLDSCWLASAGKTRPGGGWIFLPSNALQCKRTSSSTVQVRSAFNCLPACTSLYVYCLNSSCLRGAVVDPTLHSSASVLTNTQVVVTYAGTGSMQKSTSGRAGFRRITCPNNNIMSCC